MNSHPARTILSSSLTRSEGSTAFERVCGGQVTLGAILLLCIQCIGETWVAIMAYGIMMDG